MASLLPASLFVSVPDAYASEFRSYKLAATHSRLKVMFWAGIAFLIEVILIYFSRYQQGILFSDLRHRLLLYSEIELLMNLVASFFLFRLWPSKNDPLPSHARLLYHFVIVSSFVYLFGRSLLVYFDRQSLVFYLTSLILFQVMFLPDLKPRTILSLSGMVLMCIVIYLLPAVSQDEKITNLFECIGMTVMTYLVSTYLSNLEVQRFMHIHTIEGQNEKLENYSRLLEEQSREREEELEQRSRELTSYTLQEVKNSRFLEEIKKRIQEDNTTEIRKIPNLINTHQQGEAKWVHFKDVFENVHPEFFSRIHQQFPVLNSHDIRLMALLKMNLSTKEIADILGISPQSANTARYRLRKRLNLAPDADLESMVRNV